MTPKTITTQAGLLEAAKVFAAKHPGRGFNVTTREWFNPDYEIRALSSVARALVKKGKLRSKMLDNSANRRALVYHLVES